MRIKKPPLADVVWGGLNLITFAALKIRNNKTQYQ